MLKVFSFFGEQQGEFSLDITSIAALRTDHYLNNPNGEEWKTYAMDEKSNDTLDIHQDARMYG